jgi:type II secretory pathway component PulF
VLLLFEFMLVLPRYDKLFREHHLKVPSHTDLLLTIGHWVENHVLAAFLITFALMGVSFGLAHTAQTTAMSRRRRLLILLVVFGLPCLVFILAWVGVETTHRTLVEGLKR